MPINEILDENESLCLDIYNKKLRKDKVSITLTSLVAETRNFLYSMLYEKKNLVSASTRSGSVAGILNFSDPTRNALLANGGSNLLAGATNSSNEILPNLGINNTTV